MPAPRELYDERFRQHRSVAAELRRRERITSIARLVAIALAVILAAFGHPAFALVPVVAFVVLVVVHDGMIRRRTRAERAAAFCERGLSRIDHGPDGKGITGEGYADEHHPFAGDLDLFGKRSLFEAICIATTRSGRDFLARWLLHPATVDEVRQRQAAVSELRDRLDLREEMSVLAGEVTGAIEAAKLDEWSRAEPQLTSRIERIAVALAGILGIVTLIVGIPALLSRTTGGAIHAPWWSSSLPLIVMIVVIALLGRRLQSRVGDVISAVERAEPALALLAGLLARLERERFSSPRLAALRASLDREGRPASEQIARLRRLVALLDSRRNQFFAPFAALMMWTTNLAFAIERWRGQSGRDIVRWIEAVGEIEALSSLASFAFEHPDFVMPEVLEGEAVFAAVGAGHPLIAAGQRITNDVELGLETRLLIISGSNMSGKSTMLRTIGVNAVLALAGAPVCASSLRITPLAIGASIRIHDSLQEGASRFYAEIVRIRNIVSMTEGTLPLLFLLDEILHGTNSHDRRVGAEAIVRGLVGRGAIGAVSTHDLALAKIADTLPGAINVHFEDHLEDGEMRFDYRMRPGVVEKSNALALMRAVGIEV